MRIIGGSLKGKKLFFLKNKVTRPLRDLVKESVFNTILHSNLITLEIINSNILDVYSGTGSFGLECLSREASNVLFIENNKEALSILEENINNLSVGNKTKVHNGDIEVFLRKKNERNKFDIVFFDPPFDNYYYKDQLVLLKKNNFCNKKNLIVIHRENKKDDDLSEILNVLLVKKYGRSRIIFGTLIF
jgi:16S rRNA (guanine966-N2)-methyltransferase